MELQRCEAHHHLRASFAAGRGLEVRPDGRSRPAEHFLKQHPTTMNVRQASRLNAGEVINEIIARVVKIEPPKRQSEAQAKAGVHNQSIFLQDPDGTEIRMVLMKPSIHLPLTEAGARFHFRSMNDDKGR